MEKIWPALEHVDSSSGALGSAVNKTLDALIPIIVNAPADEKTRDKWLDRLWQAMADDGVDYLGPVGDRWGEICGTPEVAGRWADDLVGIVARLLDGSESGWLFPRYDGLFVLSVGGGSLRGVARTSGTAPLLHRGITGAMASRRSWPWAERRRPSSMPRPRGD